MRPVYFILLFIAFSTIGKGSRILAIFPYPGRSHQIFNFAITKILLDAGHDVTVIASYSLIDDPPANYHFTKFNSTFFTLSNTNLFKLNSQSFIEVVHILWSMSDQLCNDFLAEEALKNLMKGNETFDALLFENFGSECYMGFAHTLDIPVIQSVSYIGSHWITDTVGAPTPYSYVYEPYIFLNPEMYFIDRLKNTLINLKVKLLRYWRYLPKMDKLMRKHFQDPNMPSIAELETTRTSLLLINNHESFSYAKPGMPNMVNVAGVHIQPNKPLPSHLENYMDEAKNGFVFVSMGSILRMKEMDKNKREALVKVLDNLNLRVIFKWDADFPIPKDSKNILFSSWLPQNDILTHPNLLVFVSHGGLLSTIEAIDKGVPVLGFPIFLDQVLNMRRHQAKGLGLVIEYQNISEPSLEWAFQEILKPCYRETTKKYSKIFNDRENHPKDTILWWVEYIIRHNGAKHLRSPGLDLHWIQYYLIDIFLFILFIIILIYLFVKILIKKTWGKLILDIKLKQH